MTEPPDPAATMATVSPLLNMPADIIKNITDHLPLDDRFALSRTCRSLAVLASCDWVRELPRWRKAMEKYFYKVAWPWSEYFKLQRTVGQSAFGQYSCLCGKLHPATPDDTPTTPKPFPCSGHLICVPFWKGPGLWSDKDSEGFYLARHHVKLALDFHRRRQLSRLAPLVRPLTSPWRNVEDVSGMRTRDATAVRIRHGRFLVRQDWLLYSRKGCINKDALRRLKMFFCYHGAVNENGVMYSHVRDFDTFYAVLGCDVDVPRAECWLGERYCASVQSSTVEEDENENDAVEEDHDNYEEYAHEYESDYGDEHDWVPSSPGERWESMLEDWVDERTPSPIRSRLTEVQDLSDQVELRRLDEVFQRPGHRVNDHCERCGTDFSMRLSRRRRLLAVTMWRDMTDYNPQNYGRRPYYGGLNPWYMNRSVSHCAGDVRRLFETKAEEESLDAAWE